MEEDLAEWTPGRRAFWDAFYDEDEGRLQEKNYSNRKAEEIKTGGSLLDHYEWFMEYPQYEEAFSHCLRQCLVPSPSSPPPPPLRVLHVGCGNSDFCDHVGVTVQEVYGNGTPLPSVLNIDISPGIVARMQHSYPSRQYAVGSCCDMARPAAEVGGDASVWFGTAGSSPAVLQGIKEGTVDVVFDKGTADALFSAFAGEFNPNIDAYAKETLRVLRPGGLLFLISINAPEQLDAYVLSISESGKFFSRRYYSVIELKPDDLKRLRTETLGSHYNCYGYGVLVES